MRTKQIALVTGDGSAPEMMAVACEVARKAALLDELLLDFVHTPMGWNAFEQYGDTFPQESFDKATEIGTLFFGGVGDPKFDKAHDKKFMPEARALLPIRAKWGLLLNFRPVIYYPFLKHLANIRPEKIPPQGIKQIWIRYLLEDSYFGNNDIGIWSRIGFFARMALKWISRTIFKKKEDITGEEGFVVDSAYFKKATVEAYFRFIFRYAQEQSLPVTCIDKGNVIPRYVWWRKQCERIAKAFPDVPVKYQYVDSANALLFQDPAALHGVIPCGNEHGDILSDGAVAAMGGMGLMCSSAINPENGMAMFESGAGTAPTLAGQNKANPLGRILTAAMMLRHIGATKGADRIEKAVQTVLAEGYRTGDLATPDTAPSMIVGTRLMGELILQRLEDAYYA